MQTTNINFISKMITVFTYKIIQFQLNNNSVFNSISIFSLFSVVCDVVKHDVNFIFIVVNV